MTYVQSIPTGLDPRTTEDVTAVATADPPGAPATREELAKENEELRAKVDFLNKKLQLVGSITRHDVLNQLTAVVGYNELLDMMVKDEKLKSFIEKEKQAIEKIRRQFQFAKDYQNIAVEPPRWQNIHNVVLRVQEDINVKNIRVIDETGPAVILADPLFEKVIFHLIENAVRHGATTSEIHIAVHEGDGSAILVVGNNGAGIPAGEKEKIFERGYGKGTGWGLFLAREILAVTGMGITETGDPGNGARFEIALPGGTFRMGGCS